jgi:hypothetical protein
MVPKGRASRSTKSFGMVNSVVSSNRCRLVARPLRHEYEKEKEPIGRCVPIFESPPGFEGALNVAAYRWFAFIYTDFGAKLQHSAYF